MLFHIHKCDCFERFLKHNIRVGGGNPQRTQFLLVFSVKMYAEMKMETNKNNEHRTETRQMLEKIANDNFK